MPTGEVVLEARGACKRYFRAGRSSGRTFDAVAPLDLVLRSGELVACMGRSGSGKTTLLNMLAGLLAPTEGTVLLGGQDLYALDDVTLSRLRNEHIGVIPQGQTVLHSLTVIENVTLPDGLYRRQDAEGMGRPSDVFGVGEWRSLGSMGAEDRAMWLLGRMGIDELADSYPSELSGGELRRIAIARSLVLMPRVVLADEPTSDLDDETTQTVLKMLREVADGGATVFVVTHESDVASYADRTVRMSVGTLT